MEEEDGGTVEEEIVNLRRDMLLDVDTQDIADLITEPTNELTKDEMMALQQEQEEERSMEVTEEEG